MIIALPLIERTIKLNNIISVLATAPEIQKNVGGRRCAAMTVISQFVCLCFSCIYCNVYWLCDRRCALSPQSH